MRGLSRAQQHGQIVMEPPPRVNPIFMGDDTPSCQVRRVTPDACQAITAVL